MSGRAHSGIVAAVVTIVVAGTFAAAGLAAGGPVAGRYYDGTQTSTAGGTSLALDFQVSAGGHRVTHLYVTDASFTCPGGVSADLLTPGNKTVAVTTAHRFAITLPSKDSFSPSPANGSVRLTGTFVARSVTGRLVFTGSGPLAGCHKTINWRGKVRALVDHFTGTVVQGSHHAPISFYRTIEPHRHVTDIAVGTLTLRCPGGGTSHRAFKSVDALVVHASGTFGGDIFFTNGEAGNLSGTFPGAAQANGKVSYSGRDDCSYQRLSWSAHRVAAHVLGPLNFG